MGKKRIVRTLPRATWAQIYHWALQAQASYPSQVKQASQQELRKLFTSLFPEDEKKDKAVHSAIQYAWYVFNEISSEEIFPLLEESRPKCMYAYYAFVLIGPELSHAELRRSIKAQFGGVLNSPVLEWWHARAIEDIKKASKEDLEKMQERGRVILYGSETHYGLTGWHL